MAGELTYFGSISYQSQLKLNISGGVGYVIRSTPSLEEPLLGQFYFFDMSIGKNGEKITLGYGETACCIGNLRYGFSYLKIDEVDYIGAEVIFSPLELYFSAGIYGNVDSGNSKITLGAGIGW
ncbi:MAG: hypothetical protein OEZ68_14215 [Gammaproteobacteria bacterium]|nr:hypothetical protein [Gammaproteobacteria bacterium]MDH5801958.1 hypothetical protein [Gammaproteobacteria bacterium]